MDWLSRASIERTDRMLVFMDPVSLVVGHQQEFGLRPLLHWLAQERNWVWTHRSISQRAVDCVGNPFSRGQWDPSKSVGVSQKVAIGGSREICMVLDHTRTERGKACGVFVGFSPAWCTSVEVALRHFHWCCYRSSPLWLFSWRGLWSLGPQL
jgi:hypothetical protein